MSIMLINVNSLCAALTLVIHTKTLMITEGIKKLPATSDKKVLCFIEKAFLKVHRNTKRNRTFMNTGIVTCVIGKIRFKTFVLTKKTSVTVLNVVNAVNYHILILIFCVNTMLL